MDELGQQIINMADSSFKYILIFFNFMTLIVVYIHKSKQKIKKQHHVLFLTAHPDDEVMFFRPSISSISKDYYVHLLCLSGGQSERQQQLKASAQNLKIHKVVCLNNQNLKDSISEIWPKQQIQQIVLKYVEQNQIQAIFTFDNQGVSNHANHRSIFDALEQIHYDSQELKALNKNQKSLTEEEKARIQKIKKQSIKIYHLKTVNLIRKYSGFLEIAFALLKEFSWISLNVIDSYKAMRIHKSQFVWYRRLWVLLSQYSYINVFTMTRMKINHSQKKEAQSQENIAIQNLNAQKSQQDQEKKQK